MYFYLFIIILLLYVSFYYLFNDEISIYHVAINNFDFDLLYKKQPIVISEKIKDINVIINNWFNYNIIYNISNNYIWEKNKFKYLFISSIDNHPVEISLCNPNTCIINGIPSTDSNITTIKLDNKGLIIPFNWYYYISGNVILYGIHDYVTICISVLTK